VYSLATSAVPSRLPSLTTITSYVSAGLSDSKYLRHSSSIGGTGGKKNTHTVHYTNLTDICKCKTNSLVTNFFKIKNISKKLKLITKNTITDKTLTYASEILTLTKRYVKQLNIFERKLYRIILCPVYDNEKENWRILTNKEIYAILKKPITTETIWLYRLHWFGHVQRMEEI
jgi:hypothetical protein